MVESYLARLDVGMAAQLLIEPKGLASLVGLGQKSINSLVTRRSENLLVSPVSGRLGGRGNHFYSYPLS